MSVDRPITRSTFAHLFKEILRTMSTIAEDVAALRTAITTKVDGLTAELAQAKTDLDAATAAKAAAEASLADAEAKLAAVDPNAQAELVAAQAEIQALTAELTPPAPVPAATLFTFVGDPSTIDPAAWTKAAVNTDQGVALYSPVDPAAAVDPAVWVAYTGATVPVA